MIGTTDGKKGSKSSFPNKKSKHPMDFRHNKCDPFVEYEQLNWYGVVHKVWIERFDHIPSNVSYWRRHPK